MGQNAYQTGMNNKRLAEEDARRRVMQGREDTAYEREQAKIKSVDAATQEYGLMQKTGVRNQANIQANDVDFDMAVEATGRGLPMPAAQPQMPEWSRPTAIQDNQGLQKLSLAREDFNGLRALKTEERGLNLDEGRKAEYARLGKMKPEELASVLGDDFSRDGSGVDAMLTYDPKANKYLFASKIPGFPSQSLSRTELLGHAMGLWEAGNGDLKAGMAAQMETLKTQRQLADSNFKRSADIATADAGLYYKGREAEDRATGRAETSRHNRATEGLAASNAKSARRSPMNFVDEKGKLVLVDANSLPIDPKTGVYVTPPGLQQMKQPQVLNDRQKLAYTAAMKEVAEMQPGGDVAGVYAKYGLDPQDFGVSDPVAELAKAIQAKQAAGATAKPPTAMQGRMPPSVQQKAYDDWQASKPSWFSQQTPTGAAREKAAEQAYLEALRNPSR